jgi:hypothetical protein
MSGKPLLNQKAFEQKHRSVSISNLRRFYDGIMLREQAFDSWLVNDGLNSPNAFNGANMFT